MLKQTNWCACPIPSPTIWNTTETGIDPRKIGTKKIGTKQRKHPEKVGQGTQGGRSQKCWRPYSWTFTVPIGETKIINIGKLYPIISPGILSC